MQSTLEKAVSVIYGLFICEENKIPYKIANCYDSDIISQLYDCIGLTWHWTLSDYKAALFAYQLTISLERKGIKVFPDFKYILAYDDKVGQKYLLESIGAPLVLSHVFYSKNDALKWIEQATFPQVCKLRGGAASVNVSLVTNKRKARLLIDIAFGEGFAPINRRSRLNDTIWILQRDKNLTVLKGVLKGMTRIFIPNEAEKYSTNEKGYIYF